MVRLTPPPGLIIFRLFQILFYSPVTGESRSLRLFILAGITFYDQVPRIVTVADRLLGERQNARVHHHFSTRHTPGVHLAVLDQVELPGVPVQGEVILPEILLDGGLDPPADVFLP